MLPHQQLPRKVLIATSICGHYGAFPGWDQRFAELAAVFDDIEKQSQLQWSGRKPDLILLPENAITGGTGLALADRCKQFDGRIADFFQQQATRFHSYITAPMHELGNDGLFYNSTFLIDRDGNNLGAYRKIFPVIDPSYRALEGGITPGHQATVFDCDFGKVGFQICYDMTYDEGWQQLQENGAELVGWLTASPQNIKAQKRAIDHGYWIASSTPRNNASIIQPHSGFIHKQITDGTSVLIEEIDLSYLYLHWSAELRNGQAFSDAFGDDVGYTYSEREDSGLFWSNNPQRSIGSMAEEIGLLKYAQQTQTCYELCAELRQDAIR